MDATTLLGTLLSELLRGAVRVHVIGLPSPLHLLAGSLAGASRVIVVAAVLAWMVGIVLVLVVASDRGAAGAPAASAPRPTPPLPPRRVRATAPAPARVTAPAALPVPAPRPADPPPLTDPAVAAAAVRERPVPVVVSAARPRSAAPEPTTLPGAPGEPLPEDVRNHTPAPLPGRAPRTAAGSRCRRCTQPRCWPSTGERPPARVLGTGAPRACRTSRTAHRCAAADPWCGRERCDLPARSRPGRPGPGHDRAPALPR